MNESDTGVLLSPANESFLVEIRSVSKRFGSCLALSDISASFPRKKTIGLVGPDGSGKTTLIRLMAGLLVPTSGSISVNGYNTVDHQQELSEFISYMPQKFGLYEDLTVLQNLSLYATLYNLHDDEREKTFDRLFNFTKLKPFQDRLAGALSGGMKQKLGLACTLIRKPMLLLLDEPSVGVDPISRRDLWAMVQELIPEGITVVWSTAYLDEAEKCDSLILLSDGKSLYSGPLATLTERVAGRSFLMTNISRDKRSLLDNTLLKKSVIDGTIQGKDIRIVLDSKESRLELPKGVSLIPAPPRLEDAFIDILGGCPKEPSRVAEQIEQISSHQILVEADALTKKFGSFTAAQNISFSIQSGEIFGLLGPNGAGKSTTFKMMCGLLKPTSGTGSVNGVDLMHAPSEARSHLGYMAQKFSLYGNLSTRQNLTFFAGAYNLFGTRRKQAIESMIETFHLKAHLDESAETLPLGFKQRLALACAIMHKPSVLFLDEPTSGVDPITRREFWGHINALVQKGLTVMVTTHFMDEAEYCDRIALIYQSKIIALSSPDELKNSVQKKIGGDPTLEDAFIELIQTYDRSQA